MTEKGLAGEAGEGWDRITAKREKARRMPAFSLFVEIRGFEPLTYRLRTYRSTN